MRSRCAGTRIPSTRHAKSAVCRRSMRFGCMAAAPGARCLRCDGRACTANAQNCAGLRRPPGRRPARVTDAVTDDALLVWDDALSAARRHDWTAWLEAMSVIDRRLATLPSFQTLELVLTGVRQARSWLRAAVGSPEVLAQHAPVRSDGRGAVRMTRLVARDFDPAVARRLAAGGMPAPLARALAARGVTSADHLRLLTRRPDATRRALRTCTMPPRCWPTRSRPMRGC